MEPAFGPPKLFLFHRVGDLPSHPSSHNCRISLVHCFVRRRLYDMQGQTTTSMPPEETGDKPRQLLVTLPPEVFELIAQAAAPADLLTLRSLCREAASKVLKTYTRVHFTERAFLLSYEPSLRTLLAIAESETFSAGVRRLVLCVDEVDHLDAELWDSGYHTTLGPRFESRTKQDRHEKALQTQKNLRKYDVDLLLLTMILARFRQSGADLTVELTVSDDVASEITVRGRPALEQLAHENISGGSDSNLRPVQVLLDALAASNVRPRALLLRGWGEGGLFAFSEVAFARSPKTLWNAHQVFQHLTFLFLQCQDLLGERLGREEAEALVATFAGSLNLKCLKVDFGHRSESFPEDCDPEDGNPEMSRAILRATFPALEELILDHFVIDAQQLKVFCTRCVLLRELRLSLVLLVNAGKEVSSDDSDGTCISTWLKQEMGISSVEAVGSFAVA